MRKRGKEARERRPSRFVKPPRDRHWLGEGSSGRECLFDDLNPWLLAADKVLMRWCNQYLHRLTRRKDRPLLLIVAPKDLLPWQLGALSKHFQIAVWGAEPDELVSEASISFGADMFTGEVPREYHGAVKLVLLLESNWQTSRDLAHVILEMESVLDRSEGELFVCAEGVGDGEEQFGKFGAGDLVPLIKDGKVFGALPAPVEIESVPVGGMSSEELREFAERHLEFFGKDSISYLSRRIQEPDFRLPSLDSSSPGVGYETICMRYAVAGLGVTG